MTPAHFRGLKLPKKSCKRTRAPHARRQSCTPGGSGAQATEETLCEVSPLKKRARFVWKRQILHCNKKSSLKVEELLSNQAKNQESESCLSHHNICAQNIFQRNVKLQDIPILLVWIYCRCVPASSMCTTNVEFSHVLIMYLSHPKPSKT